MDDQVVIVKEKYDKWGFQVNFSKVEYMCMNEKQQNLRLITQKIIKSSSS